MKQLHKDTGIMYISTKTLKTRIHYLFRMMHTYVLMQMPIHMYCVQSPTESICLEV